MARRRYKRGSHVQTLEPAALFELDHEATLWLTRGVLHQFRSDPDESELPATATRALKLTLKDRAEDDDPAVRKRRRSRDDCRGDVIAALEDRVEQLARRVCRRPGRLTTAARRIGAILELGDLETRVLAWLAACELHDEFAVLARIGELNTHRDRLLLAGAALELSPRKLEGVVARQGGLRGHGLVLFQDNATSTSSFSLPKKLLSLFSGERATKDRVLQTLLAAGPAPRFTLADFAHVRELSLLAHVLAGALATKTRPVHVLLHGPPGTGKSELARALAAAVDARLCEVPTEDEDGDELHAAGRAAELRLLDSVADAQRGRFCILVDEADDLLPRRGRSIFGDFLSGSVEGKGFYNELLEGTRTPIVWTANTPQSLDAAHVRRFSLVVEVKAPPRAHRLAIAARHAAASDLDAALLQQFAEDERLPLALLDTIKNTVTMTRASTEEATARGLPAPPDQRRVMQQTAAGFLALAGKAPHSRPRPSKLAFDPSLLNASLDLSSVSARLKERPHATVLLSGPPGAGKSAWARALADALGRPLMVRAPSDILSMYVGEAEQNLARAFADAEAEGAVLLLDECDTFLFPRAEAVRSWEISHTNEMLVRVESFGGILVATTNSDRLDEAIQRRFDLKVELRPLTAAQRARLFRSLCEVVGLPAPSADDEARLADLDKLCAGDFVAVERRLAFCPAAGVEDVLAALEEERATKKGVGRGRIGF